MKKQKSMTWRNYKKRLFSAAVSLLIATVMIVSTTFAWLTLSTAPEVVGMETNIGANGSLEIALLNTTTFNDLSAITTRIGDSAGKQGTVAANVTWGNIVDVSDTSYGLGEITLVPSQLMIQGTSGNYSLQDPNGPIALPKYGTDGRIIELDTNSVSAVYNSGKFGLTGTQTYGVRGLGATSATSSRQNIINLAKTYITSNTNSARTQAANTIAANGSGLVTILMAHRQNANATFKDTNVNVIKSMLTGLGQSLDSVEAALRYGMLASYVQGGGDDVSAVRSIITNKNNDIQTLFNDYKDYCPEGMSAWITKYVLDRNTVNAAYNASNALEGDNYTWDHIGPILDPLINTEEIYIGDQKLSQVSASTLLTSDVGEYVLTVMPGSGVFSDIADFSGEYDASVTYIKTFNIEFKKSASVNPVHLVALNNSIIGVQNNEGDMAIDNLGAYAIDLAFRCNAADADLQLQIVPEQRIYSDSASSDLQGGGSYMKFVNNDKSLTTRQVIELMDTVRVTFVDATGNVLAMAKLNTSNRQVNTDGSVQAPLYLYNFTIAQESGYNIVNIGERRTGDVKITDLEQNVPKAVTAIVWLDGNKVDNTMVSAISENTLNGILNLQFSSSVDLVPAKNDILYNSNASREDLTKLLNNEVDNYPVYTTYNRGQIGKDDGNNEKWNYTDNSWSTFKAAYENAQAVMNDSGSSQNQIKKAYNDLRKAYDNIAEVSHDTLSALIDEAREITGKLTGEENIAGYATSTGGFLRSYTDEQLANAAPTTPIYLVDAQRNLKNEGNGIVVPIYKEGSWRALAAAVYSAESVDSYEDATDGQLGAAITLLEDAMALDRSVYYQAYDMNGAIYYKALTGENDTYGKWYDADFERVISDLTILDLDTKATAAVVAKIDAVDYYEIGTGDGFDGFTATADLNNNAYSRFHDDEIIGIRWSFGDTYDLDVNNDAYYPLLSDAIAVKDDTRISNGAVINGYVTTVQNVISGTTTMTDDALSELLNNLEAAVATAKTEIGQAEVISTALANKRTVLAAAINEANSLEENDGLNASKLAAETVLNKGGTETAAELDTAISELNDEIVEAGGTAQTAYNVLVHEVPHSAEFSEGINRVVIPTAIIKPTSADEYGTKALTARILTKNGVVFTAAKNIIFYNKAERIEITLNGNKASFSVVEQEGKPCNETPVEYFWSVDNEEYTLTNANKASCTFSGTGGATLTLTVVMDTGSTYTASTTIN